MQSANKKFPRSLTIISFKYGFLIVFWVNGVGTSNRNRSPNKALTVAYYFPISPLSIIKYKNNRLLIRNAWLVIGHQYWSISEKLPFFLLHLIAAEGVAEGPQEIPASPIPLLHMRQESIAQRQH
jgi:hypothetical protein